MAILFFVFARTSGLTRIFDANLSLGELSSMIKWSYEQADFGPESGVESELNSFQIDDSLNITAVTAMGHLAFIQGKRESAIEIWQKSGISPELALKLGGDYANSQSLYEAALNSYTYAVNYNPDLPEVWYAIGNLQQEHGDTANAIEAYKNAWSLKNSQSIEPLGTLYHETGNYERAVAVWEGALELFPQHPRRATWWQNLLLELRSTKQWQTMLETAEKAILEFPSEPQLYVELGFALENSSGSLDETVAAFKTAIQIDESLPGPYTVLGNLMARNQQFEEAFEWYTEAIQRDPENVSVYILRGNVVRASRNLESAIDLYQDALDRFPENEQILYELAWAYRLKDQESEAIRAIEQAVTIRSAPSVEYLLRAGLIYEWAGESEKALSMYERVLILEPGNDTAIRQIDRLQ